MTELQRGAVISYAERGDFTSKPRPGIVVQRTSSLAASPSITLCGLTTFGEATEIARFAIVPSPENGLREVSFVMVDKIATIKRSRVREVIGTLSPADMQRLDASLRAWLEL
jgi:mRNA interferase MazF